MAEDYFDGCKNHDECRVRYREMLFKLHPDQNPNDPKAHDNMISLQNQYKAILRTEMREMKEQEAKKEGRKRSQRFEEMIEAVMMLNVTVEVSGDWIWVFDALAPRDRMQLAFLGFVSSKKHNGFFWCEDPRYMDSSGKGASHHPPQNTYTMDDLRQIWGSEKKQDKRYI